MLVYGGSINCAIQDPVTGILSQINRYPSSVSRGTMGSIVERIDISFTERRAKKVTAKMGQYGWRVVWEWFIQPWGDM
jgi:hypothetical protein